MIQTRPYEFMASYTPQREWVEKGGVLLWLAFFFIELGAGTFIVASIIDSLTGMLIVVATGVIGRYIYSHVPHSLAGRELEIEEVKLRLGRYHARLTEFGLDARKLMASGIAPPSRGIVGAIIALFAGDRALRKQWARYREAVLASPKIAPHADEVLPLLKKVCREGQWLHRYG